MQVTNPVETSSVDNCDSVTLLEKCSHGGPSLDPSLVQYFVCLAQVTTPVEGSCLIPNGAQALAETSHEKKSFGTSKKLF